MTDKLVPELLEKTTLGALRNGHIFPTWQDEFDLPDDEVVEVFGDGSVNRWEDGELLAPPKGRP